MCSKHTIDQSVFNLSSWFAPIAVHPVQNTQHPNHATTALEASSSSRHSVGFHAFSCQRPLKGHSTPRSGILHPSTQKCQKKTFKLFPCIFPKGPQQSCQSHHYKLLSPKAFSTHSLNILQQSPTFYTCRTTASRLSAFLTLPTCNLLSPISLPFTIRSLRHFSPSHPCLSLGSGVFTSHVWPAHRGLFHQLKSRLHPSPHP